MGKVVRFVAPREIVVVQEQEPELREDEVRLRTLFSGISAGTEMSFYRGTGPSYLDKRWERDVRLFVPAGSPPSSVVMPGNSKRGNPGNATYPVDGMVVAPCSIHTMSAIATGISSNLVVRAADVTLKERRRLILMVRESPFHLGHLKNMMALAEMGAIIAPPIPGFYNHPQTVMDIVDHSVDRVLDLLGLPDPAIRRWEGAR